MATIAITGVAGVLGRALLAALERRDDVDRIIGVDVRAPDGTTSSRLAFRALDVRAPALADALRGADTLVHLASRTQPTHDEVTLRSLDVDGARHAIEAAAAAGVGHVVYPSSVAVYGAHPDNDLPLTEDSPLRATPDLGDSEHKVEVERWLWSWLEAGADLDVAVLRPALVAGPGVQNFMSRVFESPWFVAVRGHRPPFQYLHLDDLVSALVHAVDARLRGPYNVCAEGWLSFDEVRAVVGRPLIDLPEAVAFSLAERLWRLGIQGQPPGLVSHLMHPWVMSAERLVSTGWRPTHSNRDALAALVREHRDHLSVVGLRARRQTVRNASLALAGLAGLTAITAARRSRRRG